jgi:predicted Zn-dependent peptidase
MRNVTFEQTTMNLKGRLPVIHLKRPGFLKTYVALVFPVGGLHRAYEENGQIHAFPAGAAHFLEHKCFEKDGEEMTDVFSRQGASANAYTTYQNTSYIFETIQNLEDNIVSLIEMAFHPQFTAAGVEKEKGIIVQEWSMYQDNPFYRQYQYMQQELYEGHPYALDILGDKANIEAMDLATLSAIHEAYYQPEQATLIIAGDNEILPVLKAVEARISFAEPTTKTPVAIKGDFRLVQKGPIVLEEDVQDEYIVTGYRMAPISDTYLKYKRYMALDIVLDSVFGSSSDFYESALDQGLISDNFFTEVSLYEDVFDVSMASQSKDPEGYLKAVEELLKKPADDVLSEPLFNRLKKANIGSFIFSLESLEGMVRSHSRYLYDGITEEDLFKIQAALTFEDIKDAYTDFQAAQSFVTVWLKPRK